MMKMINRKKDYEAVLNVNHLKLNTTFSDYFRKEINIGRDLLRKKKVTKMNKT
jgi:hypothetical protein